MTATVTQRYIAAAIRSHPNVRLIEVSEENRDVLLPEILSALRS